MIFARTTSADETKELAAALAELARPGDLLLLVGDLGAGKTAFTQGFGAALGVTDHMTSPTYNLVHSHPTAGRLVLHHADLYRLSTQHEVADLAFAELAESDGIIVVEWGDVVASSFGDHLLVAIEPVEGADDERLLRVQAVGRSWAGRWAQIEDGLRRFAC